MLIAIFYSAELDSWNPTLRCLHLQVRKSHAGLMRGRATVTHLSSFACVLAVWAAIPFILDSSCTGRMIVIEGE
jgi:hypothetical protein